MPDKVLDKDFFTKPKGRILSGIVALMLVAVGGFVFDRGIEYFSARRYDAEAVHAADSISSWFGVPSRLPAGVTAESVRACAAIALDRAHIEGVQASPSSAFDADGNASDLTVATRWFYTVIDADGNSYAYELAWEPDGSLSFTSSEEG